MLACLSLSIIHLSVKLDKRMIYKIFLAPNQVEEIAIQVRGRKLTEALITRCKGKVASRSTVFTALDHQTHDSTKNKHRGVLENALELLREEGFEYDYRNQHEPELAEA